jgi:hypothetical protein
VPKGNQVRSSSIAGRASPWVKPWRKPPGQTRRPSVQGGLRCLHTMRMLQRSNQRRPPSPCQAPALAPFALPPASRLPIPTHPNEPVPTPPLSLTNFAHALGSMHKLSSRVTASVGGLGATQGGLDPATPRGLKLGRFKTVPHAASAAPGVCTGWDCVAQSHVVEAGCTVPCAWARFAARRRLCRGRGGSG